MLSRTPTFTLFPYTTLFRSNFSSEISYTVPGSSPNQPPTLDPPNGLVINEDSGQQTVTLTGISSGASNEIQTLIITASSGRSEEHTTALQSPIYLVARLLLT